MIWIREFKGRPRGKIFGALFGLIGDRLFSKYARDVLKNLAGAP